MTNKKIKIGLKRDARKYPIIGDIVRLGMTSVSGTNGKLARLVNIDYLSNTGAYPDRYTVELFNNPGYDSYIDVTVDMMTLVKRPQRRQRIHPASYFSDIPF